MKNGYFELPLVLFSVFSVFVVSVLDELLPVPLLLGLPMLPLCVSLLPVLPLLTSELLLPVPLEPIVSDEPCLALFGAFFAFFLCFFVVFVVVEVSLVVPAEPAPGLGLVPLAEPAVPWANAGAEDSRNIDATTTLSLRMPDSLLPRRGQSPVGRELSTARARRPPGTRIARSVRVVPRRSSRGIPARLDTVEMRDTLPIGLRRRSTPAACCTLAWRAPLQ